MSLALGLSWELSILEKVLQYLNVFHEFHTYFLSIIVHVLKLDQNDNTSESYLLVKR